ncbi:MAG: helix-turn-helix transcriptional regulator, partial [Rhodobacterales bacterium]|nr:helix-turn-helix transcriptional regulator [Rhodobacterales bacterium]
LPLAYNRAALEPILDAAVPAAVAGPVRAVWQITEQPAPAEPADAIDLHMREQQILKSVSQGLKNREIADKLGISTEKVKWYMKSLYGKLQARNRVEALNRARSLGLFF